jgi:hypothetical protein
VVNAVSSADLTELDVLGWDPAGSPVSSPPPSQPTGVSISPVTSSLPTDPAASGLVADSTLATLTQVGGAAGDSYTYSIGGAGAGYFALSTANNAATLSAGASGVAGASNGRLYALTTTTTDTTSGNSSPAAPLDVIVGSSGSDTVSVAALVGSLGTAVPTFVYGMGGNDTLDGSGMTGKLWLVGGAGADVMAGGSGNNDYLYGAVSDSTGSTMDVITNFHGADTIDLTGLGVSLKYDGSLSSTIRHGHKSSNLTLPAHSVGWQQSGGNMFVYVNTSGNSESLAGSDMKIELSGSVSLSSGNIVHL